jgi:glycine/D-amino acid oxidase-like deaminating enzyme
MQLQSYWLDTAPPFAHGAAEALEGRVDVAVVGGGFTGLSAALALARKGAKTVVLEAGRVASEASGRNGGQVNNGLAHSFAAVAARLGLERARALYRAYDAAVDTVERLVKEEGIDCAFSRSGKIKLAAKPQHLDGLKRNFELIAREVDPDVALLDKAQTAAEIGSEMFHGGLLQRRSAVMHVGRFGQGLAEAAARAGSRIFEQAEVMGAVRGAGGRWRLTTPRGTVEADRVLLATGSTTKGPFGWFRRRYVPVGSFIIATEPLDDRLLASVLPGRRSATTSKNIGNYFRIAPDNRLIFGGRARFAMSSPRSDTKSGRILERAMREVFPQLRDTRIAYCWGGLVDMTADRFPRAGEHDGLHFAMGYSGHGVQMSVHMGQVLAEMMDGKPEANPFRAFDWPAIPGHFGPPWFLPFVGLYYRVLDRIG